MASTRFLLLLFFIAMISMALAAPAPGRRRRHGRGRRHRSSDKYTSTRKTTTHKPTSTRKSTTATATATHEATTTRKATTTTTRKATTTTTHKAASPTSGSSSGTFSGEGTWYNVDVGIGSCGWTNGDYELVAALNHIDMANGANPNNNPKCGKKIKVNGPNGSVNVKVVDTCPGCSSGDIDLSPGAFQKISDLGVGRVHITWSWA